MSTAHEYVVSGAVEAVRWDGSTEHADLIFAWSYGRVTPAATGLLELPNRAQARPGEWIVRWASGDDYSVLPHEAMRSLVQDPEAIE